MCRHLPHVLIGPAVALTRYEADNVPHSSPGTMNPVFSKILASTRDDRFDA
ncbi:MAG: hypothetical protein JF599_07440 [Verrucomicrobia bacterium]|nr:hypothetical protein [Verrucomicrobiota bacterium]